MRARRDMNVDVWPIPVKLEAGKKFDDPIPVRMGLVVGCRGRLKPLEGSLEGMGIPICEEVRTAIGRPRTFPGPAANVEPWTTTRAMPRDERTNLGFLNRRIMLFSSRSRLP